MRVWECVAMLAVLVGLVVTVAMGEESAAGKEKTAGKAKNLLVTAEELAKQLEAGKGIRVLDVRSSDAYQAGHIPGAVQIDAPEWKAQAFAEDGFQDKAGWEELVRAAGINQKQPVVVYGDKITDVTRIWWTLKYVGVKQATVLDGGYDAWIDAGLEPQTAVLRVKSGDFEVHFQTDRLIETDELKKAVASGKVQVLDTRSDEEFEGDGHIMGATHLEWKNVVDENGRFLPQSDLLKTFSAFKVDQNQVLVPHCRSGGRAACEAFALEMVGFPKVKVYYHGWSVWSEDEDAPKTEGKPKDEEKQ